MRPYEPRSVTVADKRAYLEANHNADTDECIEWPWQRTAAGYGLIYAHPHEQMVHIIACELAHGPKPSPEHMVLHAPIICHNPACFNARHLRWGTAQENWFDSRKDGTAVCAGPAWELAE